MLYLSCTTITSVDLAHYGVSRAKDWVFVDCGTIALSGVRYNEGVSVVGEGVLLIGSSIYNYRTSVLQRVRLALSSMIFTATMYDTVAMRDTGVIRGLPIDVAHNEKQNKNLAS